MKDIFDQHINELDAAITANAQEPNVLKRVSLNCYLVQDILQKILSSENIDFDYFMDEPTQVAYSKEFLPPLFAKWLLFQKEYEVENCLLHSASERGNTFLLEELRKIRMFFERNSDFCQYYYSQRTEEDSWIFTMNNTNVEPGLEKIAEMFPVINAGCLLAATLIANEEYARLLQKRLPGNAGKGGREELKAKWTGSEIDLVEQLMVLHASGIIMVNGKPAIQKFLIEAARKCFGVELKNWEQLAQKIKNRSGDPLYHHMRIMKAYLNRQDELLDKNPDQPRKKIKRF